MRVPAPRRARKSSAGTSATLELKPALKLVRVERFRFSTPEDAARITRIYTEIQGTGVSNLPRRAVEYTESFKGRAPYDAKGD